MNQMNSNNQLQRLSLDKSFFWTGTMELNDNGGHVFFDVRIKKNVPNQPIMIGLYTNDIPPFPLTSTDTIVIKFILEFVQNQACNRYVIGTGTVTGPELEKILEKEPQVPPAS